MPKKLTLEELEVKSFLTQKEAVKAGIAAISFGCTELCPTKTGCFHDACDP